ncbi:MAG: alpha/beta hydrolase [Candidatus Krumholzibacteria bacterium]|nr:alpha/beta hydrolase [Candidatus Krumholzibacteria bacterium]
MIKNTQTDKTKQRRKTGFQIFKYSLFVLGFLSLLLISFAVWIYFSLFSGPRPMEMNDFHPFRSEEAKTQYLAFEKKMAKKWPVLSEERLVRTSFGTTFMRISGPIDAPPMVLLPGGGCNSIIWNANIEAFSQNYRTYALDNIYDYGRSVYTRELNSGRDLSQWLNGLFDTLKLGDDIRIVGYSYGGWVASQYALHHPERLSHIVLIAPVFTVLPLSDQFILKMVMTLIPLRSLKSKMVYESWSDLAQMGERGKQIVEDRIDYYDLSLKSFKFKQPVNPTVLSDLEIDHLSIPVLFLVGEHETVYNARDAISRLNRVNSQIKTELIAGTGHDLMFTHTELVNRKILEFLKE